VGIARRLLRRPDGDGGLYSDSDWELYGDRRRDRPGQPNRPGFRDPLGGQCSRRAAVNLDGPVALRRARTAAAGGGCRGDRRRPRGATGEAPSEVAELATSEFAHLL